ncbi:hypothetical protein MTYP_01954 [Methylophilaceae bacterium]|nr:hypothetical protein MTYP_01954 [Methylophilaceae bacterium]
MTLSSLIAHTPPERDVRREPHYYPDHISEMLEYGLPLFESLLRYSNLDSITKLQLLDTFKAAIMLHDMGKLDEDNQTVFSGRSKGKLPVDHIDAGIAIANEMLNELLAWVIRGHHAPGLPSKSEERNFRRKIIQNTNAPRDRNYLLRGRRHHRDGESQSREYFEAHLKAIELTESRLSLYKQRQISSCGEYPNLKFELPEESITTRLLLSCLVEADHTSSANYHDNVEMKRFNLPPRRWQERLNRLNDYVSALDETPYAQKTVRNQIRHDFYSECKERALTNDSMYMCSAPVGLGKTTSVTAFLLRKAIQRDASRLFIIAPFTNIITQTVTTLKKAVLLDGEESEKIIAECHHKVEFSNKELRQYSTNWQAPIVVTTAVQFFETLASAQPTSLRKLNALVGAVIFIDESHACLPPRFLKIAWSWLKAFSNQWGCQIVFSSGSMVEYWNDSFFVGELKQKIPDILTGAIDSRVGEIEKNRVEFKRLEQAISRSDLVEKIIQSLDDSSTKLKQSVLIIVNTVQSAAYLAYYLAEKFNQKNATPVKERTVLHLSTGLAPINRDNILQEILRRQKDSEWDSQAWFLVATSCVEAGVDIDFAVGYRERCSISSFLQTAGRINRHGRRASGTLYDFSFIHDEEMLKHPSFDDSSIIFDELWEGLVNKNKSYTELTTTALRKEFSRSNESQAIAESIYQDEVKNNFQEVDKGFKVISANTATVVVENSVVEALEKGYLADWRLVQKHSVQLWFNKINKLELKQIRGCEQDGIYSWINDYEYDDFLGIYAGLINPRRIFKQLGGVI